MKFSDILLQTVTRGGAILLLEEAATASLNFLVKELRIRGDDQLLFASRKFLDLVDGRVAVQKHDLLLVGRLPVHKRAQLVKVCSCSVYLEDSEDLSGVTSGDVNLAKAAEALASAGGLHDYSGRDFMLDANSESLLGLYAESLSELVADWERSKWASAEVGKEAEQTIIPPNDLPRPDPSILNGLVDLTTWIRPSREITNDVPPRTARTIFLDRDDVIVVNIPYNRDPDLVQLIPGVADFINQAHGRGYLVIVVSNQSGLGRLLITQQEYQQVHQKMLSLLAEQKAWIDDVYWASYIDSAVRGVGCLDPYLRKPRGGMFLAAGEKWLIDFRASIMMGDSASDLFAAQSVGIERLFLFASGKTAGEQEKLHGAAAYQNIASFAEMNWPQD